MESVSPSASTSRGGGPRQWGSRWLALLAVLGPAALVEPRLAVFAVLLLIIGLAALARFPDRRWLRVLLVTSLVGAVLGLGRFVLQEALPGIVEASARASGQRAVSRLREILFAQDAARRHGWIDLDGNGVGSAGRLGELTGAASLRPGTATSRAPLATPPLGVHLRPRVPTPAGEAAEEGGYLYLICIPGSDGRLTGHLGDAVDELAAERRFVAYAWPADPARGPAFFIDEHERILESDNSEPDGEPRLAGAARAPACEDAVARPTAGGWKPWRGKQPRQSLPGAS